MLMRQKGSSRLDNLTMVDVVAPDEISVVLLRSLVWGSEQVNDFERTD